MRTNRVERLLKLIQLLQAGRPCLVEDLAEAVGVSRRTVFRDLDLLQRSGMPFAHDRDTKRYYLVQSAVLPPVSLTPSEALTLLLALKQTLSSQVPFDPEAAAAVSLKVEGMLPRAVQDYCGTLLRHVEIRSTPTSESVSIRDMLPNLENALANRRKVRIRYDSYKEEQVIDRILHPYRLLFLNRGWYLIAHSQQDKRRLTFKIERIVQMTVLDQSYKIDADFSLDAYFGNAWLMIRGDKRHHVRIRFSKMVAGNVDEVVWHKTQRTTHEPDGRLIFEVDVDGLDEISWWVLGYGDQAHVLDPPELREMLAQRVRRMYEHYNGRDRASTSDGGQD